MALGVPAAISVALVAGLLAWLLRARRGRLGVIAALAAGVAFASVSVVWHVHRLHNGELSRLGQRHASVDAVVKLVRDPAPVANSAAAGLFVVDATAASVDDGGWRHIGLPVLVLGHGDAWRGLLPGQRVRVYARVALPRTGDDVAAVLYAMGLPAPIGSAPWWQRAAGRARDSLRRACASLPGDERGLLPSLVDGDTSGVPPKLRDDMRVSGLSHLEAVSGENLGIVLAVALTAMRAVGMRRRSRVAGAALAAAGFVVLARPSPSVQRAAVMSAVMLLAMFTGRRTSASAALAVAVSGLVMMDPFLARSIGFVLSVVATAGIVALAPAWTRRLELRLPRPIAVALAVSAAAQLACTPVLLIAFGQLTPYAVPANLLAGPAVVPATVLGVTAALVAPFSISLAHPLLVAGSLPTAAVAWVAHTCASLPGAATALSKPVTVAAAVASAVVLLRAVKTARAVVVREIL